MRLGHALLLTRMLMRFFARKVLSVGLLRSRAVRVVLVVGAVCLGCVCTGAAYLFLRPMASQPEVWRLVLETSTVSGVLWTMCAFLFVKVLFVNSEGLLELSFHLPLTGRERAVALLVYEAGMVATVAGAGLFSISMAAVLILGPGAVVLLVQTVVIPVLLTYAVLSLLHVGVLRALERTRVRRASPLVGILVVFVVMLAYAGQLPRLVREVSGRYLAQDRSFHVIAAPGWFSDAYGVVALLALAVAVIGALVAVVVALTPRQYVRSSRYLKVWPGALSGTGWLTAYDRCLMRSSQTWLAGLVSAGVFVALLLRPSVNPLWALSLLPMGGLYLFAATEPLRASGWDRSSAAVVYARLMRAQLLLVAGGLLVTAPVLGLLSPASVTGIGPAVGGAVLATVLSTFIGVMFPTENDNPFSVFIGISSTAMVGLILAAALGILQLDPAVLGAVVVLISGVIAGYTVMGIATHIQRSRHEEVDAGPERRRRWVRAHRRGGRGHLALPHVLDG